MKKGFSNFASDLCIITIIVILSLFIFIEISCCSNNETGYSKRLYWENGSTATQVNDSIVIVIDRKSMNNTGSKVINLKHK